ncbi:MAG: NlpC/P60 family protein [Methylococcaceae bacterium]|nr:MAG: NlpC/P60 family protein [Methylococcaceae bacterium]
MFSRWLRWLVLGCLAVGLVGCGSSSKKMPAPQATEGNWQAVQDAARLQGYPYRYGGESPAQGFDCSGLVQYVYAAQGVRLPRDALSMAKELPSVALEQRRPGDLLFFNVEDKPFSHVGLYVGQDAFIHAPRSGRSVMRSSLAEPYWRERLIGARRPSTYRRLSQVRM